MLDVDIPGKRRRGRPNLRWKDACKRYDTGGIERRQRNKQGRMEEEANHLYRRPQMTGHARVEEGEMRKEDWSGSELDASIESRWLPSQLAGPQKDKEEWDNRGKWRRSMDCEMKAIVCSWEQRHEAGSNGVSQDRPYVWVYLWCNKKVKRDH